MKSQVLHTAWCYISGEAGGEIWYWSLLGMKGLMLSGRHSRGPSADGRSTVDTRSVFLVGPNCFCSTYSLGHLSVNFPEKVGKFTGLNRIEYLTIVSTYRHTFGISDGRRLADRQTTIRRPPTDHQPPTDHPLTVDRTLTDHLPTVNRPSADRQPTTKRPSADRRPTTKRPSADRLLIVPTTALDSPAGKRLPFIIGYCCWRVWKVRTP